MRYNSEKVTQPRTDLAVHGGGLVWAKAKLSGDGRWKGKTEWEEERRGRQVASPNLSR